MGIGMDANLASRFSLDFIGIAHDGQHARLEVESQQLTRWPRLVGLEFQGRGGITLMAIPGHLDILAPQCLRDILQERLP